MAVVVMVPMQTVVSLFGSYLGRSSSTLSLISPH